MAREEGHKNDDPQTVGGGQWHWPAGTIGQPGPTTKGWSNA